MLRLALVTVSALAAAGCAGPDRQDGSEPASPSAVAAAVIERRGGETIELTVELARTPAERTQGLMGRESLPDDHGMLFVYDEEARAAFWMKNTLIPLSIAFIGDGGRILELLDMEPCRADPCPKYAPAVPYRQALEVNRGAFERWGVRPGDRFRLLN